MVSHYLRIAFRNLWKHKLLSAINIAGLAVGMAITLLSLLFVTNELSFDRFHQFKERIYRVVVKVESAVEGTETASIMTAGVGPSFLQQLADAEAMVRTSNPAQGFITYEGVNYDLEAAVYADSSFFQVFSFPLSAGNPKTVLANPFKAVLTTSLARKLFKNEQEAVGKIISLNNRDNLLVSGIVEDPPVNSHLRFDLLVSFTSLYEDEHMYLGWNGGWNYSTYLLLSEGADIEIIERQMAGIADENINRQMKDIGVSWNFFLQPLLKVHLNTNVNWDIETKGSWTRLLLFTAVTFIILLIACINFINLTTASSFTRMQEVGVRKVSGASRMQLIFQFLTESMLVSLLALIHAVVLIEVFSLWVSTRVSDPVFLLNFELYNRSFFQLAGAMVFLLVAVGFVAGGYPALLISGFRPALAVKGEIAISRNNPVVRNLLVVFQFAIAILLIICTLVIASQLDFLLKSDKGFETRDKLVVSLTSETARKNAEAIKTSLLSIPGVEKIGASSQVPGMGFTRNGYMPEGHDKPMMFHALDIDYDYLAAMDIQVVEGRNFSSSYARDQEAYLVNQALLRQLGWDVGVGKTINRSGTHQIIGVVENFHFSTLHDEIGPLVITLKPWRGYAYLTLHTAGMNKELLQQIEDRWKTVVPYEDFEAFPLDSFIREAYGAEKQYMQMLLFCACLTIFIAALGLFGLSALTTRQRHREIAIRKVYGAEMKRIFTLISTGFIKWVLLANTIAWPAAYLLMENYFLTNFAYSQGIRWWIFLVALLSSVVIAVGVILFQILRLSRLNPIEYIRHE